MAYITAAGPGNWSAVGTWIGGVVPGNGDTADLGGFAITMDIVRVPAAGVLLAIVTPGTIGQLTVPLNVLGDCDILAASITSGLKPVTSGIILVTGATANTLTITANLIGGVGNGGDCVNHNSTGNLIVDGNVTGGTNNFVDGITNTSTGSVAVTGNVAASTGHFAMGIYNASTGAVMVTGNVSGGAGIRSSGIYANTNGPVTLNSCNLIDGTGGVAYSGYTPTWNPTAVNYHQLTNGTRLAPEVAAGVLIEGTPNGLVVGDYHEATVGEVRLLVGFGSGSALIGTDWSPAVTRVQVGTGYGAGGVEFVGTLYTTRSDISGTVTQKIITGTVT